MSDQLLAFSIFAAAVLLLSIVMWPSPRRLNGQQKYRRNRKPGHDLDPKGNAQGSITPAAAFFGFLFGSGANDTDADSNFDGFGDGGDSGGDAGGGGK